MLTRRRFHRAALAAPLAALGLMACQDKPQAASATPAAASAAPSQDAYALASQGHGFTVGPVMAAHTVYVFFDPACPHCAHLWSEAKPLAARLKMVWMPVQLLRPASGPQGATILSAPNPSQAMEQNEASVLARGPGIPVADALPDDALAKVKANTQLFNQSGADSVPFIVFRNANTGQVGTHAGAVSTAELAAMAGI